MNVELMAIVAVIALMLSAGIGALFWDKKPILRLSPVLVSILLGFLYFPARGIDPDAGQLAEMVLGCIFAGSIINLGLWVECRGTRDKA